MAAGGCCGASAAPFTVRMKPAWEAAPNVARHSELAYHNIKKKKKKNASTLADSRLATEVPQCSRIWWC